jgi:hypothetical protein
VGEGVPSTILEDTGTSRSSRLGMMTVRDLVVVMKGMYVEMTPGCDMYVICNRAMSKGEARNCLFPELVL